MVLIQKFDARNLALFLGGVAVVAATVLFNYLLWPQFKSYLAVVESRSELQKVLANDSGLNETLVALQDEVQSLRQQLHGDMASLPANEMQGYIIGRLQGISWRNKVEFVGLQPREGQTIEDFQEILFEIQLLGSYFNLYEWLRDASRELGFVVIKRYQMSPVGPEKDDPLLGVKLTMAVYRSAT